MIEGCQGEAGEGVETEGLVQAKQEKLACPPKV